MVRTEAEAASYHQTTTFQNKYMKQNTFKMSGQLSRVGPTLDQLLAKYMKKVAPHIRQAKQSEKGKMCESKDRLNQPKR
jgi:hypothetical protein